MAAFPGFLRVYFLYTLFGFFLRVSVFFFWGKVEHLFKEESFGLTPGSKTYGATDPTHKN